MDLEKNKHLGSKPKAFDKFLEEAYKIHGDKYNYSNFNYKNCKTKGLIHCNKCGTDFYMLPTNHICMKQGCPTCNGTRKYKSDEWIAKCKEKYDYDYSETEYIDAKTKVKIICHEKDEFGNEHGEFWKIPRKHLQGGQGCPKCSRMFLVPFDEFVKRSVGIHGDKYIYHKDEYINFTTKTRITCPKHGDFYQKPQVHASGCGCQDCFSEKRGKFKVISFEEFVKRAKEVYGDKYSYHEDNYVNYNTKTVVTCPKHGDFEIIPSRHVERHYQCKECTKEEMSKKFLLSFEEFKSRSISVHGDKYDYSKSIYKGNGVPLEIICPIHGSFWQKPTKHWLGQGCPKCNQSHLEREIENALKDREIEYTYQATKKDLPFIEMKSLDFYLPKYKIGIECQGIQHFEDNGFLKSEDVIKRDKEKFDICSENGITIIYYTNLVEKTNNNNFYKDKIIFNDVNNLFKILRDYEATN